MSWFKRAGVRCEHCKRPIHAEGCIIVAETKHGVLKQVYYHFYCYKEKK